MENIWNSTVDTFGDIITGIGDNFAATGTDAQARANYNQALADLARARANSEMTRTKEMSRAINTAVIGIIAVLAIMVIGKYIIPKLK